MLLDLISNQLTHFSHSLGLTNIAALQMWRHTILESHFKNIGATETCLLFTVHSGKCTSETCPDDSKTSFKWTEETGWIWVSTHHHLHLPNCNICSLLVWHGGGGSAQPFTFWLSSITAALVIMDTLNSVLVSDIYTLILDINKL